MNPLFNFFDLEINVLCCSLVKRLTLPFGSATRLQLRNVLFCLCPAGKTTVTQLVSKSLNAVLLQSPPPCISQWRKIFDDEPTIIRRAFYSLGNYLVASEIAKESATSPVIVDRWVARCPLYTMTDCLSLFLCVCASLCIYIQMLNCEHV